MHEAAQQRRRRPRAERLTEHLEEGADGEEETIDVLMAGYLSKDAAMEDFNAVKASGADLTGWSS